MEKILIMLLVYMQDSIDFLHYEEGRFTYRFDDVETAIKNSVIKRGFRKKLLEMLSSAAEAWINQSPFMAAETLCNMRKLQKRNNLPQVVSPLEEYREKGSLSFLNKKDIIYSEKQLEYVKDIINKGNKNDKKHKPKKKYKDKRNKPLTYKPFAVLKKD